MSFLKCGAIEGVYPTIDFGHDSNVNESFIEQRKYAPRGPLVLIKNDWKVHTM